MYGGFFCGVLGEEGGRSVSGKQNKKMMNGLLITWKPPMHTALPVIFPGEKTIFHQCCCVYDIFNASFTILECIYIHAHHALPASKTWSQKQTINELVTKSSNTYLMLEVILINI